MSTPNDTLREIHERCKARHEPWPGSAQKVGGKAMCVGCDLPWPCPDHKDALAALRILDEAPRYGAAPLGAVHIYDPRPDPGGRAAPPPTTTTTP